MSTERANQTAKTDNRGRVNVNEKRQTVRKLARRGCESAVFFGAIVALGGCAAGAGGAATLTMLGTALTLMMAIAGCTTTHGPDNDGDGFGAEIDCDDDDPSIHPEATEEFCPDGVDSNCDGEDTDGPVACNPFEDDFDGDGFFTGDDCDDSNADIYPGAPEDACPDGVDQNCDGIDGDADIICNPAPDDLDGDGFPAPVDCDDTDPDIHPEATEPDCPDGIDQNCDGEDGLGLACNPIPDDLDGDGWPASEDCDDTDPAVYPGAAETSCPDGIDSNCDGRDYTREDITDPLCNPAPDGDDDGWGAGEDCDDTRSDIHPSAQEYCDDGVDSDCDGDFDDDDCLFINGMMDADDIAMEPGEDTKLA